MKRQILAAVLIFTMILGGFFYYDLVVQESEKEAFQLAKDVSSVQFDNITEALDNEVVKFLMIEDYVNGEDNIEKGLTKLKNATNLNQIFKNYSIYTINGELLLQNGIGTDQDYNQNSDFKEALKGSYSMDYQVEKDTNRRRLDIFCPIRKNHVTNYMMVFSYFDEQIDRLLFKYTENEDSFLNNTYNMIIDAKNNVISSLYIPKTGNFTNEERRNEIMGNIINGKEGQFVFESEEYGNYTVFYQPIYDNNFGLMTAVPYENIFNEHIKMFDSFAIYLVFCIISLILIAYMFNSNYKKKIDVDKLTGLLNKQGFEKSCKKALRNTRGILIVIDVDNFKQVNDNYGHLEGDKILMEIAEVLGSSFRQNDLIARFGGDEFVVFITKNIEVSYLQRRLYFINESVKDISDDYVKSPFSLSFGIQYTNRGDNYRDAFNKADNKLYVSKQNGKDQMIF